MVVFLSRTRRAVAFRHALFLAFALILGGFKVQAAAPTLANQKYGTAHERQVLDFWKAKSNSPTPVVIYFHGGGFKVGDKSMIRHSPLVAKFLKTGISLASVT